MDDQDQPFSLLNIYEVVNEEGVHHHFVCFLEPERAHEVGIDPRSVVGEFTPGPDKQFDPATFVRNPAFIEALTGYMNGEAILAPGIAVEAQKHANGWLYVVDPRCQQVEGKEPPGTDLLGGFAVDGAGKVVPDSFTYNDDHVWFDTEAGVSGVLSDTRFYEWLHAGSGPPG
jgi:hypothetical protein